METKTVLAVGGGLGALSAAIRLAKSGLRVKLFEKNSTLGGKINQHQQNGFRWDTGPTLLTMPFVIEEIFDNLGKNRSDYLNFLPLQPLCRYFFSDQTVLDASSNRKRMLDSLGKFSPNQLQAYLNFMNYSAKIFNTAVEIFLFTPIHEHKKLLKTRNFLRLFQIMRIDPFRNVNEAVSSYFKDQRLVQLFDRYATYNGSDPFQAPATLNIIPYVENELGGYYIEGGMYQLVQALEKIARELGVEIYTNTHVDKIKHINNKITGLLVQGEFIAGDYVVAGADVVETFNTLIDNFQDQRKKLNALQPSLSGMVFLWAVKRNSPSLAHHNIIFSSDYRREFSQLFYDQQPPDDPTIYIAISSKSDSSDAAVASENWFVLLNMPYLHKDQQWDIEALRMKEIVVQKLKSYGLDVSSQIQYEKYITPLDFYERYSSNRGSIYGLSSNSRFTAFRRPANRSRIIDGLYFAGGSTHPGGGIPLVLLSGKMVAELIAEKEKILQPSSRSLNDYLQEHIKKIAESKN